jgi:thymidylate kinase
LENAEIPDTGSSEEIPYSNSRSKREVQTALLEEVKAHPDFILAGVNMNWCEEILSRIEFAFWVKAPLEKRLERIRYREEKRFGERALRGGDMYEQQEEFRKVVASREEKSLEECVQKLSCPVVVLNGTLPVEHNIKKIREYINGQECS